jgi:hypothetical protein
MEIELTRTTGKKKGAKSKMFGGGLLKFGYVSHMKLNISYNLALSLH